MRWNRLTTVLLSSDRSAAATVRRERDHPLEERLGAAAQLGQEAAAAGEADPKGVRPEVLQLLTALRGQETSHPDDDTPKLVEAIDRALQQC